MERPGSRVCWVIALGAALGCASVDRGVIRGTVEDSRFDQPIANAFVFLQCECMPQPREAYTNEKGVYSFRDLPPGNYTVQVLAGRANEFQNLRLLAPARYRADFVINPGNDVDVWTVVKRPARIRHEDRE